MSRSDLSRALAVNALTRPVNVLVPAGVLVAGALAGVGWLALVALVCWLALVAMTFFDEHEARRIGERVRAARRPAPLEPRPDPAAFAPAIAGRVRSAMAARAAIRAAIADSRSPFDDVNREIDELVVALEAHAARAQRIHEFLTDESARAASGSALARLRQRLGLLLTEMDRVVAALQTVRAEILATDGLQRPAGERALASQVFDLRAKVQTRSEGLEEAFADTRVHLDDEV